MMKGERDEAQEAAGNEEVTGAGKGSWKQRNEVHHRSQDQNVDEVRQPTRRANKQSQAFAQGETPPMPKEQGK
jgi:hypothetical protein